MNKLDQLVIGYIKEFPTLYQGKSYNESKMKVLDYLLNVIGNGIRDNDELREELSKIDHSVEMCDIRDIVSGEKIYTGYAEVKDYGEGGFSYTMPVLDSAICSVPESKKHNYPEVIYWSESYYHPHELYPNFQEKYSTIYICPSYFDIDDSFIEGAIEFYKYALQWLKDNESKYHYAFPKQSEEESQEIVKSFSKKLSSYDCKDSVSEAYGCEFTGDVYDFLVSRWQKEKNRIIDFINQSISKLEEKEVTLK